MAILRHATRIKAPKHLVYAALTDVSAMQRWHVGTVEGEIAVGKVLTLTPKPSMQFSWRTESLETDSAIVQTALSGPGSSAGKTLTFTISELDDGRTQVELADDGWSEDDPHLPFCNSHWGEVLYRLRSYVEQNA